MARRKEINEQIAAGRQRKSRLIRWILPILPIILLGGLFSWIYQTKDIVMKVGPEIVRQAELDLEIKRLKPPDYDRTVLSMEPEDRKSAEETLRAKALENLMKLKSVYLYARENNIDVTKQDIQNEIDKFTRDLASTTGAENIDFRTVLSDHGIAYRSFRSDMRQQAIYNKVLQPVRDEVVATEDEIVDFYRQYKEYYDIPNQAKVMLIALDKAEEAERILALLLEGGDFSQLARDHSLSPDALENSGDIGWITPGELYKEIADNIFHEDITLDHPYIIQARDGFYIFKVLDRKTAEASAYDDVREYVEQDLLRNKQDRAVDLFMYRLTEEYEFRITTDNPWRNILAWFESLRGRI
jgi:parvulin-like peptidyl-prolyl isomerase